MDDQGTILWRLAKDGHTHACSVRLAPDAIEVDMLNDNALISTRAFATGDEALAWAERRRLRREEQGWTEAV